MDINEIRITEGMKEPGPAMSVPVYFSDDAAQNGPSRAGDRWNFRMPSARAIADAIIRRSLSELRG